MVRNDGQYISEFGEILLFIIGGILFALITLFFSRILRPHRPNPEKLSTYESGEEPTGVAWTQFNIRFYIVAIIFLLFEVEILFLFPWAVVLADKDLQQSSSEWTLFAVLEAVAFIIILAIGLAYAWIHGFLDWVKPSPHIPDYRSPVPKEMYWKVNRMYSKNSNANDRTS